MTYMSNLDTNLEWHLSYSWVNRMKIMGYFRLFFMMIVLGNLDLGLEFGIEFFHNDSGG
jgi:hypothetical protein